MAYNIQGFNFNPTKDFTFNPSNSVEKPVVPQSSYIPKCGQKSEMKEAYHKYAMEYANQFGMTIVYQPKIYNTEVADPLYGEDTISGFHHGREMKAVVNFESYSAGFFPMGFLSKESLTVYIPIRHFEQIWGPTSNGIYPVAGDLFYIPDSVCDRPLRQSPIIWEIGNKFDAVNETVDFLSGHYVWKLECTRYKPSHEKNAPTERFLNDSDTDSDQFGEIGNPSELSQENMNSVDDFAKKEYDMRVGNKNDIFGQYI